MANGKQRVQSDKILFICSFYAISLKLLRYHSNAYLIVYVLLYVLVYPGEDQ